MIIRAYLRASTSEQDANRAREQLKLFVSEHGARITTFYVENASGAVLERPELQRLLSEAQEGEILLIESVDRLSRLPMATWEKLRNQIQTVGLQLVAADMPITYAALKPSTSDPMQAWMLKAIAQMFLEFMAAFARKDYERRRHVQRQGIETARMAGLYKGRAPDLELHSKIMVLLSGKFSVRQTAALLGCSPSTVQAVKVKSRLLAPPPVE
ncbi:recombinase family protein [Pseudomonas sp. AB12(2023)]|uniref:recombinase family protein n=1 Tax=Pseudomonas sp. AB12(2023) TaxID=3048597 RepID=UPI002B233C57|nr:recombinase family protein [Pseudomonas sp. AB12(2023)]MEB0221352.1 recombinase family protein [Pseudomonas sp. AB12(2023)]